MNVKAIRGLTSQHQDQAECWLVMLRSPNLTPENEAEFFVWLEASPAHQAAYLQAEQTWERGKVMVQARARRQRAAAQSEESSWRDFFNFGSWQYGAIASVLFVALGVMGYSQFVDQPPTTVFYQTAVGEQRDVLLSDGSTLTLNTNSRVKAVISRNRRVVYLESGEVFFSIASKPDRRPFDVYTDTGMVRVLGTKFTVYDSGDSTLVTVQEGSVGVDQQPESGSGEDASFEADVTLKRNQQVVVEDSSTALVVQDVDASAGLGWRSKSLVFRGDPLQKVVDQINRYFEQQIKIGDEALAQKQVAAVIQVSDFEIMLSTLTQALNLEVVREPDSNAIYLHRGSSH